MPKVLVTDSNLTNIANSIRNKLGVQTTYKPSEMSSAIDSIQTGSDGTEFIKIVERSYNVCISIPNVTTKIAQSGFINFSNLSNVNIQDTVTYIDNYAFLGCLNLALTSLPNRLTSIGS